MSRSDRLAAGGLVAATLVCAWGLAAIAGTADIPRTDDWGFARIAFDLHRTGHLHLIYWGPMTMVGHLLWAQPFLWLFGDHHWVLGVSTSVLIAAGVVAAYRLARLRLGVVGAGATVVVLLVFPGVVRDAASYMTDSTALALQLVTLALGGLALRSAGRRRTALFGASLLTGFWAFGIREFAVAAPLAVLATVFFTKQRPASRLRVALVGAVFAVACLVLWVWHRNLPGIEQYGGIRSLSASAVIIVSTILSVAVAVAPAVALSAPRWWRARNSAARIVGAVVGVGVVAARPLLAHYVNAHNWWLVGDYLQADGINGGKMLLGQRPIVLNSALWHLLLGTAMISTVICSALIAEWIAGWVVPGARQHRPETDPVARLAGWHVGITGVLLVVAGLWNGLLFDRYIWPLVFTASFLLFSREPVAAAVPKRVIPIARLIGGAALLIAIGSSALLTLNSAAFDAARWNAASAATGGGLPATEVDGGVEWDGAHSSVPNSGTTRAFKDPMIAWWTALTGMSRVCVVVTAAPINSKLGHEIRTVHWRPWLFVGDSTLHVYQMAAPACP